MTSASRRTPESPLRVGIVGCGNVSRLYLPDFASLSGVELAACTDVDVDRAAALAERGGVRALAFDELLADPTIDVVLNLTPAPEHARVSLAAIEAGKHVYSEKPLATDLGAARAILVAADRRGVRVGCAPDTFLGGGLQTARDVLDSGAIGTALGAHAAVLHLGPERWHPDPEGFFGPGGGPLLDVGPYYIAALVSLLGPVVEVDAIGRATGGTRRIGSGPRAGTTFVATAPTYVIASYRFASGVVAGFTASFDVVASAAPHLEIHGTEGSILIGDPNVFDGEVSLQRLGADAWEKVPLRSDAGSVRGIGLAEMTEAITSGRPHRASGELAFHVLEILLATEAAIVGDARPIRSTVERPLPIRLASP
jgi:predicted dehydrogenase